MAKIFLAVPLHTDQISTGTVKAIQLASSTSGHDIALAMQGLSLLARNFNHLFVSAVERNFDYMCILHGDIGVQAKPGLSWLDRLLQALLDEDLAALSAVVPLKHEAGFTSTALVVDKTNPYGIRRLTVTEMDGLPPILSRDIVANIMGLDATKAGPLLINTGCLMLDVGAFADKNFPGFCITDSLAWTKGGKPKCFTIPEDWGMSHWMYDTGLPYAAAHKIIDVSHFGGAAYTTSKIYGVPHDEGECGVTPEQWQEM